MKIHFQIEYITRWGENLFLCLDSSGKSPLNLPMNNNGHGIWYADYEFDTNSDSSIEYSYLVQTDGVVTRREEGPVHTVPCKKADSLVIYDRWKTAGCSEMEQRAVVVPFVHHNGGALWKGAGTAIPVFSLRSEHDFGIGEFTDLMELVDWAAATGQCIIQTLPVNDTTLTGTWKDSYPYSANSSFALHPIYINLELVGKLDDKVFINRMEQTRKELNSLSAIDYERVSKAKNEYLDRLYEQFGETCFKSREYKAFFKANRSWLEPYALYCYLRDSYKNADFHTWKESAYKPSLLKKFLTSGNEHYGQIRKHMFIQFHLDKQLSDVKKYANSKGILLKGDVPIGLNRHSADVWIHPELFHTDCQAGAPPDAFATDGQRWGLPTYNWDNMARDNYSWFADRFRKMADYFNAYRIDHLLGFFRIWEVPLKYNSGLMGRFNPARAFTAAEIMDMGFRDDPSKYAKAPDGTPQTNVLFLEDTHHAGMYHPRINGFDTDMYKALTEDMQQAYRAIHDDFYYRRNNSFWSQVAMSKLPALIEATDMLVCGEDLGMIPDCVPQVMDCLRILALEVQRMPKQFGVSVSDPKNYPYMSVCTTSTHDMSVLRAWIQDEMEPNPVISDSQATASVCQGVLQSHLDSASMLAIFPLQDWLAISTELRAANPESERINVPANPDNYWCYRMHIGLDRLLKATGFNGEIREMIARSGR